MRGRIGLAALLLLLPACERRFPVLTNPDPYWLAEFEPLDRVLIMRFTQTGGAVTGTARLTQLQLPGIDDFTVSGAQRGDSLDLDFTIGATAVLHFLGAYTSSTRLSGRLNGGVFQNTSAFFTKQ